MTSGANGSKGELGRLMSICGSESVTAASRTAVGHGRSSEGAGQHSSVHHVSGPPLTGCRACGSGPIHANQKRRIAASRRRSRALAVKT